MDEFTPPETGTLVPERDPQALADVFAELLTNDAKHAQMSKAAHEYALQRFDARRNVRVAEQTILMWCK
jgi:glycosyltransferase involved in cell wall biosynthesis